MPGILSVTPLEGYCMQVDFNNGDSLILDLSNKLATIRFEPLSDKRLFKAAITDGKSIVWNDMIEISTTELFNMAKCDRII
ncbi:MAG: DUF2442 domain-containing protein [Clostridiales bacterium]|nr:DUF2442 domain-containing protein [Clostridiales bacterium]